MLTLLLLFFCFKQKTAYEMRMSDWSSDVCSSDLAPGSAFRRGPQETRGRRRRSAAWSRKLPREQVPVHRHEEKVGDQADHADHDDPEEIGRASCTERECQYV